jgi:hypothetical protein
MEYFLFWIGLALIIGLVGNNRKIGFVMAFFWALILSPLIGLIIVFSSDKKKPSVIGK